ncbi:transmembrane protein 214-A [Neodiprion pinetum]|uniref:Transmembrane protein 214-A n=1 Tax=Neodiprion lecontei TaxID=441921 RepID=A0A6J0BH20_NEOLC|nr:transmembrane protein 214-A [Neodiprion lecontei]XP_046484914.1 transmembrane protein 214-A [Neodiprion pinetum]
MSYGGWEVVGKNKKDKSNGKPAKLSKAEKKKFMENAPKLEDFLPLDEVKTLYNTLDNNKENKKPVKEKESKTKENEEKKKQQKQKQQQQQQAEKKKTEPKEKPPKSIEGALNAISIEELKNILATNQARFPEAPLVWLKDILAYLCVKIPIDTNDPVFGNKPADYPLSVVPNTIRSILESATKDAGSKAVQIFYEITLTAMTNNMVKGTPVVGHKIFLQFLAYQHPETVISNIPKLVTLRNSYQNRKPIGLSLLWALAQGGQKNLTIGLKIWHEVMASMLEMKNYASYVVQILERFTTLHGTTTSLSSDLYLNIADDVYSGRYNIPASVEKELSVSVAKLRTIIFKNKDTRHQPLFQALMKKLTYTTPENYKTEIINALVASLSTDTQCYSAWRSNYTKYLHQSSLLLKHLNANWTRVSPSLRVNLLRETILTFIATNEELGKAKKKEEHLNACVKECKVLLEKMTVSKSWFPWKRGSVLLLVVIGAMLAYDTQKHGSFKASNTNRFLTESGVSGYGEHAWSRVRLYSSKSLEFIEASAPEYYKAVTEFSTPYVKLAGDLCLITKNTSLKVYNNIVLYAHQKGPLIAASINHYAPGLLESMQKQSIQAMEAIKTYSALASDQANILVGHLNSENLRKYTSQAINTTQTFASQTYNWVYEKVQTLTKVH